MDLSKISNTEILHRLERLAPTERKITHLILWHIAEVETRKLFIDVGFASTKEYLIRKLKYSEGSAARRLEGARLLIKIPEAAEKIETGVLNLSQVLQVQKCLKHESKNGREVSADKTTRILSMISEKTIFETERVLAKELNQPILTFDKIRPQQNDSVRMEVTLTADQMKELEQAESFLSHICHDGSWANVLTFLAQSYNKKIKGKELAAREVQISHSKETMKDMKDMKDHSAASGKANAKYTTKCATKAVTSSSLSSSPTKNKRSYIPVNTRRNLLKRANYQCEYKDLKTNTKCCSSYQLQFDHSIPVAKGGNNSHLRVLCKSHNLSEARRWGLHYKS